MKKSTEKLRATFLADAEKLFDEMLKWEEETEKPDLSQIEELVLELRKQLGARLAESLLMRQEERQPAEKVICEQCGRAMENKGMKRNQVESRVGGLEMERAYHDCPGCKQGIFPPG